MSPTGTAAPPRPLVRRCEQQRLDAALARAAAGDPSMVVLAGDAGVGKSCLLRSVAEAADATVLFGTCALAGDVAPPLSPIVEALRFSPGTEGLSTVIAPVLELLMTGTTRSLDSPHACRTEIFQTILDLIEQLAERRPTLIVLEDLHAGDRSTLDFLSFIVANLRQQRLAVMVSYRSEDLVAEHPWRPLLAEMVRYPRVDHVNLPPFDRRQVAEQLTILTGRVPDETTLDEIVRRTHGNAYFVEELIDHEHGTVRPVTLSLRELLLVKFDALTEPTCRLLRIMSLERQDTTDTVLAEVAGVSIDNVRAAQREALDHRVLTVGPVGLRFRHSLLREAIEQDLLAGERRELHVAFAQALSHSSSPTGHDRAGHLATLAYHWFGAGDVAIAMRLSLEAATAAERMFAWAEAHDQLERVLRHWDRVDEPVHTTRSSRRDLLVRAAGDAFMGGQSARACELTREALGRVDVASEPNVAGILYERLARYTNDTPDRDRAMQYCGRAVALVAPDPPTAERARVLAGWAAQLMIAGRLRESHVAAKEALQLARLTDAADAETDALNTLGVLTCALDNVDDGLELIRTALHSARTRFDAHQQMRAYWNLQACTFEAARWEECLECFHEARTALPRLGEVHLVPELYCYAADVLVRLGRWDEADALIDDGLANLPGPCDELPPVELPLVRGQFEAARELIAARETRNVFVDDELRIWSLVNLADLEAWSGHCDEARQALDEAFDLALGGDFTLSVGYAVAIGLRVEADAADVARKNSASADEEVAIDRARSLVVRIRVLLQRPGPTGGWKREVLALALAAEAELTRALGASDPEAWAAAVAAWRALDMPYEAARCQFGQASALLGARAGREQATDLLVEAGEVAARLGALPLRAQIDALARRARIDVGPTDVKAATHGLTGREREVLSLLASGATNRGIADALFISVKTAGVHVSNILRKLEVANRAEAISVAFRDSLVS